MRNIFKLKIKGLTVLASLLAAHGAVAEEAWKPAAALMHTEQGAGILKNVIADRGDIIKVDYALPAPSFELNHDQKYNGENTELCRLGNAWLDGEIGEPLLPCITARIILPYGRAVKDVRVVPMDTRTAEGQHLLSYAETPIPLSSPKEIRTPAKDAVYESSFPCPRQAVQLAHVNNRCGVSIATIHIYPVQYSPRHREFSYWKNFRLEVETEAQRGPDTNGLRVRLDRFEENGLTEENPGTLATYPDRVIPGAPEEREAAESYSLVIVTSKGIINASTTPSLKDFVAHKTKLGFTCKVEAIEDIGKDTEKLRNYLREAYNKWNTKFVILGGDTGIIPLKTVQASNGGKSDNIPTDLPYQCLAKEKWDNDYEASVYIGRISAENETEFANQIYKSMAFENTDPKDPYLKSELGAGEKLDAKTQAKTAMEAIQKIFPSGWTFGGIYDADNTWPSKDTIFQQTNSNKYSVIDHFGHSQYNIVMKVTSSSSWNTNSPLKNNKFFFAKSQGCIPGAFDKDCAAEHWTTSSRTGAWGVVYNSRYGWYAPGNPTGGSSHVLHLAFWNAFWKQNLKTVAQCNDYSHRTNTRHRWDILESNYFGDPTVSFTLGTKPGLE